MVLLAFLDFKPRSNFPASLLSATNLKRLAVNKCTLQVTIGILQVCNQQLLRIFNPGP